GEGLVESLPRGLPAWAEAQKELAETCGHLASLLETIGRRPEAEAYSRRALALHGELVERFPAFLVHRQDLAGAHIGLGWLLHELGRPAEAEASLRAGVSAWDRVVRTYGMASNREGLAGAYARLAAALHARKPSREAEELCRKSLELRTKIVEDDPRDGPQGPATRWALANSHAQLGEVLRDGGRAAEAEPSFQGAREILARLVEELPRRPAYRGDLARVLDALGELRQADGRFGGAAES